MVNFLRKTKLAFIVSLISTVALGSYSATTILQDKTTPSQQATVSAGGALKVDGSGVTQPVSGTFWQGTQPISGTLSCNIGTSGSLALDASVTGLEVTQGSTTSGQSGTFVQGAVTTNSPSYTTAKTDPLSLDTSGNLRISLKDTPANTNALKVDGSGVTQPVSGTLTCNAGTTASTPVTNAGTFAVQASGTVTANIGTSGSLALDASVTGLEVAQGSTTSGQNGAMCQGATTTNAPTYTTAKTNPLSLDTTGLLRVSLKDTPVNTTAFKVDGSGVTQPVSGTFWQGTQPISGTVTANAGTNLNTSALALDASVTGLQVATESTTSGQKGGIAQGAVTTNSPTYTTAKTDPLSLDTAGNLRVSLKDTPANTNKFLVTADPITFASAQSVNATLAAETTKVIGTINIASSQSVTANAGTNLNTSALALDASVTGLQVAQESTTSGQKGGVAQGAVTTNAPTYTTAKSDPLSLDTSGLLRVSLKDTPANTNKFLVTPDAITIAGAQTLGTVTTVGTVTSLTQFNGNAIATNTGTRSAGTLRVTVATDDVVPASQSGTWTVQPGNTANSTPWLMTVNDGTNSAKVEAASTAAAAADKSLVVSQNPTGGNPCSNPTATLVSIKGATSGTAATQIIALSGSTKIYLCSVTIIGVSGTTPTFSLVQGTGSNCATGQAAIMQAWTTGAGTLYAFANPVAVGTAGAALCYLDTGTTPVQNYQITYVQQ